MTNKSLKFIKERSLNSGSVWYDPIQNTYIKRGDGVDEEAEYLQRLFDLGFPVPRVVDRGKDSEGRYYSEQSLGATSLHEMAVKDVQDFGTVQKNTISTATSLSHLFFRKQLEHVVESSVSPLSNWFEKASYFQRNIQDYPPLNSTETQRAIGLMFERLSELPMSYGHFDYGLPNIFPDGIIDWQYKALSPIGFDVYLMMDLAAFMGGTRGYTFTKQQRQEYIDSLDRVAIKGGLPKLSNYRGDFLLAKSFFFITTVRKGGPEQDTRRAYRRYLCQRVISEYNRNQNVDVSAFPTLSEFVRQSNVGEIKISI